ncbi:MAG TPA: DUF5996 family protein [Solirubrobacter sp.]|nr:DUF5996 family protein [Solirubrobacter sp.]
MGAEWPSLRVEDWTDTRETLHLWTQIVGKVRLARAPMVNHWWQVTLYVTPTGLTTSMIPPGFEIAFDFCAHVLRITALGGEQRTVALAPRTVADFYGATTTALAELGYATEIWPVPVEIERAIPFAEDTEHASYDPDAAHRFWLQLVEVDRVLHAFRARYGGKVSPVHFFWGALDMAVTRFSGRRAPRHPGGAPNCGDWVMVEGYSHELSSCGFWPGGGEEGAFYAYAYPEPDGFATHPVGPAAAFYSDEFQQFLLPYEAVRTAPDPDAAALEFLQDTYEAAAIRGGWDRAALEYVPVEGARPPGGAVHRRHGA